MTLWTMARVALLILFAFNCVLAILNQVRGDIPAAILSAVWAVIVQNVDSRWGRG